MSRKALPFLLGVVNPYIGVSTGNTHVVHLASSASFVLSLTLSAENVAAIYIYIEIYIYEVHACEGW